MSGRHRRVHRSASVRRGLTSAAAAVPPALASAAGALGPVAAQVAAQAAGKARLTATTGTLALTAVLGTTVVSTGAALTLPQERTASSAAALPSAPADGTDVSAGGSTVTGARGPRATGTATARSAKSSGRRSAADPSRAGGKTPAAPAPGKVAISPSVRRSGPARSTGAGRDGGAPGTAGSARSGDRTKTFEVRREAGGVTAGDVIRLARSQLGTREDPAGETTYNAWYVRSARAAETAERDGGVVGAYRAAPWCDMFVSWLGDRTGTTASMGSDAYTIEHAKWFQQRKRWGERPKAGALVFFDWNGKNSRVIDTIDHVGLVVRENRDGTIQTIEGNTNDAVVLKNRPATSVVGYGYPDFAR